MIVTRVNEMREFRSSEELSDICVVVDQNEFHLHKFPLCINSDFFRALCRCGMMDENRVTLSEFPGGAKTFSLIADYCYGLEIDINTSNVVELRCAAEFLQMTSHGNLASDASIALRGIVVRRHPHCLDDILHILSSMCTLGAIANHPDIVSPCFSGIFQFVRKRCFLQKISEALMILPVEWFVTFVIGARDASVNVATIASLVSQYLQHIVRQNKSRINEYLEVEERKREADDGNTLRAEELANALDAILLELPESATLSEVMNSELLCLLIRLATHLHCKCEGILLNALSNNLEVIPREILVTMPTKTVISIVEHNIHTASPTGLCNFIDEHLWERTKQNAVTLEEFEALVQTIPKAYRPQHDSILLIAEKLFATTNVSEELKLKTLDVIDVYRIHEETLRKVSEGNIIPSSFIVSATLAVASRLRNELTEAKAKLADKEHAIRETHASITDVIKGQWEYNDVTLNVTPKDENNTRVQLSKVEPHSTSSALLMKHEVYDGKLTLCVRACRGTSMQTFLFDPFNEQLLEITRSKHDNLMIGENYQKKKHTTSYWPFADVASSQTESRRE